MFYFDTLPEGPEDLLNRSRQVNFLICQPASMLDVVFLAKFEIYSFGKLTTDWL